jgi:putative membrane protein
VFNLPLTMVLGLQAMYLWAFVRQKKFASPWNITRLASFSLGIIFLALAFHPAIYQDAFQDINGRMIQHLLIGMLAPLGLVFGAPITLFRRSVPKPLGQLITRLLHSGVLRCLTHPFTALTLYIGGMALFYLGPFYKLTLEHQSLHWMAHGHFLFAGYLFAWSIAGPDPAPKRPSFNVRLTTLFLAIMANALLSNYMYTHALPAGTHHSPEEIRTAAKLLYHGGDVGEMILLMALFLTGLRSRFWSASVKQDCASS